jgi:hypothetical protein
MRMNSIKNWLSNNQKRSVKSNELMIERQHAIAKVVYLPSAGQRARTLERRGAASAQLWWGPLRRGGWVAFIDDLGEGTKSKHRNAQ